MDEQPSGGSPSTSSRAAGPDEGSLSWLDGLRTSPPSDDAVAALHAMLLRMASAQATRRSGTHGISGRELEDLAHQAADDATLAVLRSLDRFRGESRFTTWAYAFVVHEMSSKINRHVWRHDSVSWPYDTWTQLPGRLGSDPEDVALSRDLLAAVEQAVVNDLTWRQRRVMLGVLAGLPVAALTSELGTSPAALHKVLFDARRKIRLHLVADGHLPG